MSSVGNIDVVVPTIRDLDFLEAWEPWFEDCRVIVVQDGDHDRAIEVPDIDLVIEHYDRTDIEAELGDQSWVISQGDSACRCFGFLMADANYVYTVDDDCFPAERPDGEIEDVIDRHRNNLATPGHPSFFNTLYDQAFVGGYPYARRQGVPTAISHGLWLGVPDFGAPGQMVNPNWRNEKYVDVVQTVSDGVFYPMCGMNLAFNRELIGPAMYFGLMGEGQLWARHGDMWAGWCTKAICDHLTYAVKSGRPYVRHEKRSDWQTNLRKEYNGIFWEDSIVSFFQNLTIPDDRTTVAESYLYLADRVAEELRELHEYFERLAEAMRVWIELWKAHA